MKNKMNATVEKLLLGFASGVMIAASVWSLLMPSIGMAESQNIISWIPASVGFLLGILFLLALDSIVPHLHLHSDKPEGIKAKIKKTTMLVFAVTLHNIPEGMAVGVTFAFLQVNIIYAVIFIGCVTFVCSAAGVNIGSVFGEKYKSKAEICGGIILILIGIKILFDGLGIL